MTDFIQVYRPLIDLFLLNCGFAFSQYIVLRAGVFSIGTAGLAALGAYTAAILFQRYGVDFHVALAVSTMIGTLAALLLAVPLARLRGAYQAIATLAFVQIVSSVALIWSSMTGGPMGLINIPRMSTTLTLFIAVCVVAILLLSLSSTRLGLAIDAVRQDETVAGSLGVSVYGVHMLAFGISGAIAGLFGGLEAMYIYTIDPGHYTFHFLTAALAFVVIGGRKSVFGPIAGAAIMTSLPEIARPLADNRLLLNGALIMLVIAYLPHGVVDSLVLHFKRRASRVAARKAETVNDSPST